MATIYETMRAAILTGSPSPVAAIVDDRVYADELPDPAELPAVVVLLVSGNYVASHLGGSEDLAVALVQVDCWAGTRAVCDALAQAVKTAVAAGLGADATLAARRDGREPQSVKQARRTILEFNVSTTEA